MQFRGTEIRIRGIVLVKFSDRRIAKQNAPTSVWLKTVFVGVNDKGIDFSQAVKVGFHLRGKIGRKFKIATVSGIGVKTKFKLFPKV